MDSDLVDVLLSPDSSNLSIRDRVLALGRLLDVTRGLAEGFELTEILAIITREACRAVDCERATLFRYDPRTEELYSTASNSLETTEIRKSVADGICGYVARERILLNVADPAADPRWSSRHDAATGFATRNLLAAPVLSPRDGGLLGVLELLNNQGGPFDRFDEQLLLAFSQHVAVALERATLMAQAQRQHELTSSLVLARQIQRGFLPGKLPQVPGYEVAAWWRPHQMVGGDYCDCLRNGDRDLLLVMADVSGHGLGPGLLMAGVRAALHAVALEQGAPARLLNVLARTISDDLPEDRFVTMLVARLDPERHLVRYANAGHGPCLHYSRASGAFRNLEATGLPLGVESEPQFTEGPPCALAQGDVLLLGTDGIVETANGDDEPFGLARLMALIREGPRTMDELVTQIGQAVLAHHGSEQPPDDVTILALGRLQ